MFLAANSTSTVNDVEPGLLGFLMVAALGLALYFLLRSMNKQFRKLGPRPEDSAGTDSESTVAEAASAPASQRPLRGLAAHRAAMAAAEKANADAEASDAKRG
jgi:hypothetical protein